MTDLAELQDVLTEFFAQKSSPERLDQLQQLLTQLEQEKLMWKSAVIFLSISNNHHVCMFSLGVLELAIKRCCQLTAMEVKTITECLEKYAFHPESSQSSSTSAAFLRFKAVKIWTTIHKQDFAANHTFFLNKILFFLKLPLSATSSVKQLENICFAFTSLRVAYEELIRFDVDLGTEKCTKTKEILHSTCSQIIDTILNVTENLLGLEVINASKFLLSCANPSEKEFYTFMQSIFVFALNLMFKPVNDNINTSECLIKVFSNLLLFLCVFLSSASIAKIDYLRMYTILHIFTTLASPALILEILRIWNSNHLTVPLPINSLSEISLLSLSCIQEVAERIDLPRIAMTIHLKFIYPLTYWHLLIHDLNFPISDIASSAISSLSGTSGNVSLSWLNTISRSGLTALKQTIENIFHNAYQKLSTLLKLLITNFLLFISEENISQTNLALSQYSFSVSNFLDRVHYFTFTTCQAIFPVYLLCLDIWTSFLSFTKTIYCSDSVKVNSTVMLSNHLPQYAQLAIAKLCSSLVSSIYFSESAKFLNLLDDDVPIVAKQQTCQDYSLNGFFFDDVIQNFSPLTSRENEKSDLKEFMQASFSAISMVAFFMPKEVVSSIATHLQNEMNWFSEFANSPDHFSRVEHNLSKLHNGLRDLATSFQCLCFQSEYFASLMNADFLRWLLQSAVTNLCSSKHLCDNLDNFYEKTICQDMIRVVIENIGFIRCLLVSQLIKSSEYPTDQSAAQSQNAYLTISIADKDSLVLMLLQHAHHLLFNNNSELISGLQFHSAQLYLTLITAANSPGFFPPVSLLWNSEKYENDGLFANSNYILDLIHCSCSITKLKSFQIPVQRVFIRFVTVYLLTDEIDEHNSASNNRLVELNKAAAIKLDLLKNHFLPIFLHTLQSEYILSNRDLYFLGLCWFNECLASLRYLGGKSRRKLLEALSDSGLLNRLWHCLDASFSNCLESNDADLCIANLSFFVQFIDVYGNQQTIANLIPQFVTAVLKLLELLKKKIPNTNLASPIMLYLIKLLNMLVKNRKAFAPLVSSVLHFCTNYLLLGISSLPANSIDMTSLPSIITLVDCAAKNDLDLCLSTFELLFQIVSFGFTQITQLSSNSDDCISANEFDLFMRFVMAVFCRIVDDTRLIIQTIECLCDLNVQHNLFNKELFTAVWKSQLSHRILILLVSQPRSDAVSGLMNCLFDLYSVRISLQSEKCFQSNEFWISVLYPFLLDVQAVLPIGELTVFNNLALTFTSSTIEFKNARELHSTLSPAINELNHWSKSNNISFMKSVKTSIHSTTKVP